MSKAHGRDGGTPAVLAPVARLAEREQPDRGSKLDAAEANRVEVVDVQNQRGSPTPLAVPTRAGVDLSA